MKRLAWCGAIVAVAVATTVVAQPPGGGRGGRGGPPEGAPDGGFRPPPPPIIAALDVDRDHVLSAEEIKNAPEELSTLDRNKDGKLSEDEFMGPPPGDNRRGARDGEAQPRRGRNNHRQRFDDRGPPPDGPPDGGPRGFGGPPGDGPRSGFGSPGPPSPEQFVQHALQFDADKDGKLSAQELRKMAEDLASQGPRGPGGAGGPDEDGPPRGDRRPRRPD